MSREAKHEAAALRSVLQFMQRLPDAQAAEQVYAAALDLVQELFTPHRAFVALTEFAGAALAVAASVPGTLSDVVVPIYLRDAVAGRLVLQYENPRLFCDQDFALLEIITAQCGFALQWIKERQTARDAQLERNELVAMAVHELRTPLTAILGGTFLLRRHRDDDRGRAVDIIERNARLQVTLIDELLQASQLSAAKVKLQLTTLDLASLLDAVIEEIEPAAGSSNVSIYAELQRPLMVRGDAQRLWQIFSNLLINSVRYASPHGEVRVSGSLDSAGARVCVQDDGLGISEDQVQYIFERFHQAHPPNSTVGGHRSPLRVRGDGGIGLRPAIVNDLVTLHGGTVTAESAGLGKGSCFTVKLPSETAGGHRPPLQS